jgi:PIN domain nuclease of toxin-antitoxin system
MRLLLDTHIWVWSYMEPQRLTSDVARELIDPKHERYLSPVSVWELMLLLEKNKIKLDEEFEEWFTKSIAHLDLLEAPVQWQVAYEFRSVRLGHKDPADRLLVATAKVHDMTLVTADERLMNVPGLNVLANR